MTNETDYKQPKAKSKDKDHNSTVVLWTILIAVVALGLIFWPRHNEYKYKEKEMFTKASGVKYKELKIGKGAEALLGNTVVVNYTGYLTDGTKFDSSHDRGQPLEFTLGKGEVIEGFDDGIFGMKVGGKRQLVIPPEAGYGEEGTGSIPPNATLVFIVELLEVK
jgi:FKBP-type peptidyl-prolyl cis-trans isomerase